MKASTELKGKIIEWFATGDTGLSSITMASCIAGVRVKEVNYPYDPDDLNRCLLFLEHAPEAREHLGMLRFLNNQWRMLILNWKKIEDSFLREAGLNWSKARKAPDTYKLMKSVLKVAEIENNMELNSENKSGVKSTLAEDPPGYQVDGIKHPFDKAKKPYVIALQWGHKSQAPPQTYLFETTAQAFAFKAGLAHGIAQYPNDTDYFDLDLEEYITNEERDAFILAVFDSNGHQKSTILSEGFESSDQGVTKKTLDITTRLDDLSKSLSSMKKLEGATPFDVGIWSTCKELIEINQYLVAQQHSLTKQVDFLCQRTAGQAMIGSTG